MKRTGCNFKEVPSSDQSLHFHSDSQRIQSQSISSWRARDHAGSFLRVRRTVGCRIRSQEQRLEMVKEVLFSATSKSPERDLLEARVPIGMPGKISCSELVREIAATASGSLSIHAIGLAERLAELRPLVLEVFNNVPLEAIAGYGILRSFICATLDEIEDMKGKADMCDCCDYQKEDVQLVAFEKLDSLIQLLKLASELTRGTSSQTKGDSVIDSTFWHGHDSEKLAEKMLTPAVNILPFLSVISYSYNDAAKKTLRAFISFTASARTAKDCCGGRCWCPILGCQVVRSCCAKRKFAENFKVHLEKKQFNLLKFQTSINEKPCLSLCAEQMFPAVRISKKFTFPHTVDSTQKELGYQSLFLGEDQWTVSLKDYYESNLEIRARVITQRAIKGDLFEPVGCKSSFSCCQDLEFDGPAKTLVFHIHGGGFVAQTSFNSQPFSRKLAIDLDAVVISLDYCLAPDYQFPVQVDEAYAAYRWILHRPADFGWVGRENGGKIVVVGESAGGNLAAALTVRAIHEDRRCNSEKRHLPDGLILVYPVTVLEKWPSMGRLCSLLDPILYYHFFSYVFESYVPSTHQQFFGKPLHSYLSPGLADAKTLSMFPPTRIVVGEMDPLVDDSVCLYQRLSKCMGDVEISILPGFAHAFANFMATAPEVVNALNLISIWILEIIDKVEYRPGTKED